MKISLNYNHVLNFVTPQEVDALRQPAESANQSLHDKNGKGNDFLGWVNLPEETLNSSLIKEMTDAAAQLTALAKTVVVIGIGGSYLGAKGALEWLGGNFSHLLPPDKETIQVLFAGQNMSEDYLSDLLSLLSTRDYGVVVISKSGTTTEPAIAFRLLQKDLENRYGKKGASQRIIAITDAQRGALRQVADQEGYRTFVIPDDVGGRFSVLSPVGLVPIAIAGYDLTALLEGAAEMARETDPSKGFEQNIAVQYAAVRNALYRKGKKIEVLVNYDPRLHYVSEWWKQLYGESEGKEGKGLFPAAVDFSSDLHSMGQYIQEGERSLFETVLSVKKVQSNLKVPTLTEDIDQLNYLAGKSIDSVNKMAELGTLLAHVDGGVPNLRIEIEQLNKKTLGEFFYFFEKACGISGYLLGVNPFDQPGVEAYKRNMFALLGKSGFEEETRKLQSRLKG